MNQNQKIAQFVNTGAEITPLSAMMNLGVARLASRINEINNQMVSIGFPKLTVTMKRTANNKRYAAYHGHVPSGLISYL